MTLPTYSRRLMAIIALLFYCLPAFCQPKVSLTDARSLPTCTACRDLLESWPKEVLFGISMNKQGEVFFTMTGGPWFDQFFTGPQDGVAVDLVTKDQFDCTAATAPPTSLPKGQFLPPVYLADLKKNMLENSSAHITIKIGVLPDHLKNRYTELEGNLTLLKNGVICYHTFFTDIDRSVWELLPMGLYGDTLISTQKIQDTRTAMEKVCDRKVQFVVPFAKGKTTFSKAFLQYLPDSLQLSRYYIKNIDLEAFTSVEGPEDLNLELGAQRMKAVEAALQPYIKSQNIIPYATENWEAFYKDIEQTPLASLSLLSQEALTEKLQDKRIKQKLESILKHHRKAIVTFYLDNKSRPDTATGNTLATQFKQALTQNNIYKAALIQEEVIERVADSRLPAAYMDSLEIPREKPYLTLLADRATYQYQYGLIDEYQALENFKTLIQIDPSSSRLQYNICSLTFSFWEYDTAFVDPAAFLEGINTLYRLKVDSALVRRMLINYHIVTSEHSMHRADYAAKDRSVDYIVTNYVTRNLSDEEMLTVAKYLCFYSQRERAIPLVERLVKHKDVTEDLLFYYINMKLFEPFTGYSIPIEAEIRKAAQLNRSRFCKLFNSINNGGASFQLLKSPALKSLYCEYCK